MNDHKWFPVLSAEAGVKLCANDCGYTWFPQSPEPKYLDNQKCPNNKR